MDRVKRIKEIIEYKQRRLDELANPDVWHRYTKNMECGEEREFKQSCESRSSYGIVWKCARRKTIGLF